ncbi:hypothetical protein Tco_1269694, partial [Tanacetum coccineum]
SVEISDLNMGLREKGLVITALKDELRKLKGKDLVDNVVTKNTIALEMLKIDEQAAILRKVVEQGKSQNPLFNSLDSALKPSTSASGSQPSGNTKKDKIQQTPRTANVQHCKLNANFELKCVKCNGCMLFEKFKENACPLTRITTTTKVPHRIPSALDNETPKPVVTLVYSWKPRKSKTNGSVSKSKVVQIVLWYLDSGCSMNMTRYRSQLTNFVNKFLGIVKFGNDHVAKILGYGDYQIGSVTISMVYYVEGLGHNLFSVGQFCDSNLDVAFRQHTCFIHNLEGVDLLTGSRGNNLYTLSLGYDGVL